MPIDYELLRDVERETDKSDTQLDALPLAPGAPGEPAQARDQRSTLSDARSDAQRDARQSTVGVQNAVNTAGGKPALEPLTESPDAENAGEPLAPGSEPQASGVPPVGAFGELPELEPMPEMPGAQNDGRAIMLTHEPERVVMPAEALALLGVDDADAALERLETIAIDDLVRQGVPEVAAREIVSLRKRVGGGRNAHDKPPERADAPIPHELSEQPAEQEQPAQQQPISPAIHRLARQIEYIRQRTGVDMLDELRASPELMAGVAAYSQGRGGMDIMGAYERLRAQRTAVRPRVPATQTAGSGQLGGGRIDVSRLTDAQMDDIDRRVRAGERVIF